MNPYNRRGLEGLQRSYSTGHALTTALVFAQNDTFESHSHPITQNDDLIIIVVLASDIGLRRAMDNQRTLVRTVLAWEKPPRAWETYEEPICHSIHHVGVIPVRTVLTSDGELIGKRRMGRNRTLGNSGNTIGPIRTILMHSVCVIIQSK